MPHPDIQKLQSRARDYSGIHGKLIVHELAFPDDRGNKWWVAWCCECNSFKNIRADSLKIGIKVCYDCKPNQRNTKPSVQQQAEFNRNRFTKGGYEI